MNYAAILHSASQKDCFFLENGRLRVRLQTGRGDIAAVYLHTRDKYIPPERRDTRSCVGMQKYTSDFGHDYFRADLEIPEAPADSGVVTHPDVLCLRYFFELVDEAGARIWYGDDRFFPGEPGDVEAMFDCPLISRRNQCFRIPDWAKSAVVYQIFPTRFASSRQIPEEKWYQAPIGPDADLHGDLAGITANLPHLKDLGVDVVYLTPIFRSDSSHKYDTIDYYEVDPSLGTADDLHRLIDSAHSLGLRVMLDGVFNHTSPEFFAFKDIRKNGRESAYWDWYHIDRLPLYAGGHDSKPSYQSFAYQGYMPKLNLENPDTAQYVIDVGTYYLREFHIDGWRLDVGDEIGHAFWKKFRRAMKEVNSDALLVGEIWHFAPEFLQGDEWDSVMNYAFFKNIASLICYGEIRPSEFLARQGFLEGQYHSAVLPVLWNLIDSHDTSRFLCRAGEDRRKLRLAAAMQMLLPGTPFLYYGDEVGMTGGEDPDNRRGMLWDPARQDHELYAWYQRLTYFRHVLNCIPAGEYSAILPDDRRGTLEYHLRSGEILLFHVTGEDSTAREYIGCHELLSGQTFDGSLPGYACVLLRKE